MPPSTQYAIWTIRCIDGRKFVRTLKQSNSLTYNPSLSIYKVQSLLEFAKKIKKYFPPVDLFSLWISLLGPRTPTTLSWCSRSWSWWWIPHVQQIGLQTDICRERRVSKQKGRKKRQKIHPKESYSSVSWHLLDPFGICIKLWTTTTCGAAGFSLLRSSLSLHSSRFQRNAGDVNGGVSSEAASLLDRRSSKSSWSRRP